MKDYKQANRQKKKGKTRHHGARKRPPGQPTPAQEERARYGAPTTRAHQAPRPGQARPTTTPESPLAVQRETAKPKQSAQRHR